MYAVTNPSLVRTHSLTPVPFKAGKHNKGKVAAGVTAFFVTGLTLPLVAGVWQLYVPRYSHQVQDVMALSTSS